MFLAFPPLDPRSAWNDHFFYWGQANTWFGLNQPLRITSEVQGLLDLYRIEYYYEKANGTSQQPPYVYRVGVPLLAGLLGLALSLSSAFFVITISSFVLLGIASGWAAYRLSRSISVAALASVLSITAPGLSDFTRFYAMVDVPAMAITAVVLALLVCGRYSWALGVAGFIAPLVKETSIGLALMVALYMWLQGKGGWGKWIIATVPFVLSGVLRMLVPVPAPPSLSELFVAGSPYESGLTFVEAFGFAFVLVIGILAPTVRSFTIASTPVFLSLIVVNSSVVASGPRIWLTVWPLLVVLGLCGWATSVTDKSLRCSVLVSTLLGVILANAVLLGNVDRIALSVWLTITVALIAWRLGVAQRRQQRAPQLQSPQ